MASASEALRRASAAKAAVLYTRIHRDHLHTIVDVIKFNAPDDFPVCEGIEIAPDAEAKIAEITGRNEMPLIFIKGSVIGGAVDLGQLAEKKVLVEWLRPHQYDLIVIGGGSGGLAAAKAAASSGRKVACLDFVQPSPVGTTWGLGGTCVNVGCIPKKLMHQAALLGHSLHDAREFGWEVPKGTTHNWTRMKDAIQAHIAGLNWGYRVQLREKLVTYVNSYGVFSGTHEISATNKKGKVEKLTADTFLIATGLRPKYPDCPGAKEYCITSDDLFALPYSPGKTLCVGASYVALECAGFLAGLGYEVKVMVRSILLRGFDQDMAERIRKHMLTQKITFISAVPSRVEQLEAPSGDKAGRLRVFWTEKGEDGTEREVSEEYNTVLMAIGREAVTAQLGLNIPGVQLDKNGKVKGRLEQSVSCPYVYAVGDVLSGCPELTPVAIQAGKDLMHRIYEGALQLTEYDAIPTTVFTPLEYGCCGISEERAIERFGEDDVVIYHNVFLPLEYTVPDRSDKDHCYLKLICVKSQQERVHGFHILCPSAGEVTQGFGIALKLGACKADFDRLIGIHPTVAENFTTLTLVKKQGGEELKASGC